MYKRILFVVMALLIAMPCLAAQPETEHQKTLYAMGVHLIRQMAVFNLSAEELEFVKQGMTDVVAGTKLVAEPEAYSLNINSLAKERMDATAKKQKEMSRTYLEKAGTEPGAQKSASGLIYMELKAGTGIQPRATDTVKVHYVGTLIDGKIFDSSVKRGEPVEFALNQVIPCWTEGVAKMKAGGKARLVCPPDIAYGDQGRPPVIPGGATLVFEVELLDIKAASSSVTEPAAAPKARKGSTSKKP